MKKVCFVGEALIDFTPAGISESGNIIFERNPGGGPANASVSTAVLGAPSYFLGKTGDDDFGRFLKNILAKNNVDVTGLLLSKEAKTSLAFVQLDETGNRSFSFYRDPGADLMYREDEIDYEIIDRCDILHFSTVSMTREPARTATRRAVEYAKANGKIISYDPNLREMLWDSIEEAKSVIVSMLDYADILKISGEELEFITGKTDIKEATEELFSRGIPLIFSTLGPDGCYYRHKKGSDLLRTYDTEVVDTTGSGDAFVGAVLYKMATIGKPVEELDNAELWDMTDFANAAGSTAATIKGGIPAMPTVEKVEYCRATVPLL